MTKYIINRHQQLNGDFEIHRLDICPCPPETENQISLGDFNDCHEALIFAIRRWPELAKKIDGCKFCCPECHHH